MKTKKIVFCKMCGLLIILLGSIACENEKTEPPAPSRLIEGDWELSKILFKSANVDFTDSNFEISFSSDDDESGEFEIESSGYSATGEFEIEKDKDDYVLTLEFEKQQQWFLYTNSDGARVWHYFNEIEFKDVTIKDNEIELDDGEDDKGYEWEWELEVD